MLRRLLILCGILISTPIWSINCIVTVVKDTCWTDYEVSLDVVDPRVSKIVTNINIAPGAVWGRGTFVCQPNDVIELIAKFTPVFWESEAGKSYQALKTWGLPDAVNPGDTAWTISVCFPRDFSQVPFPPKAKGNCQCDFTSVPEPKT